MKLKKKCSANLSNEHWISDLLAKCCYCNLILKQFRETKPVYGAKPYGDEFNMFHQEFNHWSFV